MNFDELVSNNIDLEKLKCALCENFLSYFPIFISTNNENICGRCAPQQESPHFRNTAYETLSQFIKFPCCYKDLGCPEEECPEDIPQHEKTCPFRLVKCPLCDITECKWQGSHNQLTNHCNDQHSDIILKNEEFEVDISKDFENVTFIEHNNLLFLVKLKFNLEKKLLQCAIHHLQDDTDKEQFSCKLHVKNTDRNVSLTFQTSGFEDKAFAKLNLESLQNESETFPDNMLLKTEILDIKSNDFKIGKELSNLKCLNCSACSELALPPLNYCWEKFFIICSSCIDKHTATCYTCADVYAVTSTLKIDGLEELTKLLIYPCKNKENGCKIEDKFNEIKLHHEYCTYGESECPVKEFETCHWKGLKKDVGLHVETTHQNLLIQNRSKMTLSLDAASTNLYIVKFANCFFKLVVEYADKTYFYWTVQLIGHHKETFRYEIEIFDENDRDRRLNTTLPCLSSRSKGKSSVFYNRSNFYVDRTQIQDIIQDGKFYYMINIFKN